MRAGSLTEKIVLMKAVNITDEYGADQITYEAYANLKANIFIAKSDRMVINDGVFFPEILTIQIRYTHEVQNSDRIIYQQNPYRILSVFKDRRKKQIDIKAELIRE